MSDDYPFTDVNGHPNKQKMLDVYKKMLLNCDNTQYLISTYPKLYRYLKYDASLHEQYENEEYYQNNYGQKIQNLYGYSMDTPEYTNTIKTMCYVEKLDLNIDWDEYFNFDHQIPENYIQNLYNLNFSDIVPIYWFNYIRLLSLKSNSSDTLKKFINDYTYTIEQIINDESDINITTHNIDKIFIGIVRIYINNDTIVNFDDFLMVYNPDMIEFFYMCMRPRSMVIDYLIDNPHIDVNIESKYNNILDTRNNTLIEQYRIILNEHKTLDSIVGIINQLVIPTKNEQLPELLQLYAEPYNGWSNIVSTIYTDDIINNYILRDYNLKNIAILKMLKYCCRYLRTIYPNNNDGVII
jgi:hypothetical protein